MFTKEEPFCQQHNYQFIGQASMRKDIWTRINYYYNYYYCICRAVGSVGHRDNRVGNNAGTYRQEICTVYDYIYCTCVFVYVL